MTTNDARALSLILLLASSGPALASDPDVAGARIDRLPAERELGRQLDRLVSATREARWLAWNVAAIDGGHDLCCRPERSGARCSLEPGERSWYGGDRAADGWSDATTILVRAEDGRIDEVRGLGGACPLDAGRRHVLIVQGVAPDASARWLGGLTRRDADPALVQKAATALAHHGGEAAFDELRRLALEGEGREARHAGTFWLGAARGMDGVRVLETIIEDEERAIDEVEHAVFALSISKDATRIERLTRLARHDPRHEIRSAALFWLAQAAGERAAETIGDALRDDPDTRVKEQAVFALSQLPPGEGVPRLIEVARSNRNPEVRRAAMFWLGQSGDDRALAFFEEVLGRE